MRERLSSVETEVVGQFREQYLAHVNDLKGMLDARTNDSGKIQMFSGKKIERMQAFMDKFIQEDNVCGDEDLSVLIKQASGLLAGVDPKELKSNDDWRKSMAGTFGEIATKLVTMTRPRGRRLITPETEDATAAEEGAA